MSTEKEQPSRFNEVFDHSKKGFEAFGVTEEEFSEACQLVSDTCCQMGNPSEDVEYWCEKLTKKELALLVKEFKHQVKDQKLSKMFFEMVNGIETKKPTEEQKNSQAPNEFNDIYDHTAEDTEDILGVKYEDMDSVCTELFDKFWKLRDKPIHYSIEVAQKTLTPKQLAMLYVAELKNRIDNPINGFLSFLGGLGRK